VTILIRRLLEHAVPPEQIASAPASTAAANTWRASESQMSSVRRRCEHSLDGVAVELERDDVVGGTF